jgi:hypothetical protein
MVFLEGVEGSQSTDQKKLWIQSARWMEEWCLVDHRARNLFRARTDSKNKVVWIDEAWARGGRKVVIRVRGFSPSWWLQPRLKVGLLSRFKSPTGTKGDHPLLLVGGSDWDQRVVFRTKCHSRDGSSASRWTRALSLPRQMSRMKVLFSASVNIYKYKLT